MASWLGIGQENVIRVAVAISDNSIRLADLEDGAARRADCGAEDRRDRGHDGLDRRFRHRRPARQSTPCADELVAEFSLPQLPHLHADAVIGWAWSVFNDYDFEENPLGFRGRTVRALAAAQHDIGHLRLADSIGIDFHKTGYTPYISSLVLFRDDQRLQPHRPSRETMPYLYQSGEHHPGMYTLETTRSGIGPMAALANLLLLGKEGFRALLGHAVEMAEVLRELIESHPNLTVLNGENVGPGDAVPRLSRWRRHLRVKERERSDRDYRTQLLAHNDYNRRIFERVHGEALGGHGVAHLADQLLPADRLRRPDRRAEVVRALAVCRREPDGLGRQARAGGAKKSMRKTPRQPARNESRSFRQ